MTQNINEKSKYFTPSIEDIRVGYEYEVPIYDYSCYGCQPLGWESQTVEPPKTLDLREYKQPYIPNPLLIRVPYLTKEQIEAEGWDEEGNKGDCHLEWGTVLREGKAPWYFLVLSKVVDEKHHALYSGECKDVNTLRWLCKLLNI